MQNLMMQTHKTDTKMIYTSQDYASLHAHVAISAFDGEYYLMVTIDNPRLTYRQQLDEGAEACSRAIATLPPTVRAVFKRYFLSDATNQAPLIPRDECCAVSIIEQPPLNGTKVAIMAYLVDGPQVSRDASGMVRVGHGGYTHLWRASMTAPDLTSEVATIAMLGDYALQLRREGCTLADNCVRTWFFVHDVDTNYPGVVRGRNQVFDCSGLTIDTHFIASTGIGGRSADPTAMVSLDTYAVKGLEGGQVRYLQAPHALNPTYEYGVAFERGTAVDYGDRRHVWISGTASIDNKGQVVHDGDIVAQTMRMLYNVETLLADADCAWGDMTHAIVYLRDMADYTVVRDIFAARFGRLPMVIVHAPVCRTGWLVEMECNAIKAIDSPYGRW